MDKPVEDALRSSRWLDRASLPWIMGCPREQHAWESAKIKVDGKEYTVNAQPCLDLDFVRSQFPAFAEPSLQGQAFFENAGGSYACAQVICLLPPAQGAAVLQLPGR